MAKLTSYTKGPARGYGAGGVLGFKRTETADARENCLLGFNAAATAFVRACEEATELLGKRGSILHKMKKQVLRFHRCPTVAMLGVLNKWRAVAGLPDVFVTTRAPYNPDVETRWQRVQRIKKEQDVARMDAVLSQPIPKPPPLRFE